MCLIIYKSYNSSYLCQSFLINYLKEIIQSSAKLGNNISTTLKFVLGIGLLNFLEVKMCVCACLLRNYNNKILIILSSYLSYFSFG